MCVCVCVCVCVCGYKIYMFGGISFQKTDKELSFIAYFCCEQSRFKISKLITESKILYHAHYLKFHVHYNHIIVKLIAVPSFVLNILKPIGES